MIRPLSFSLARFYSATAMLGAMMLASAGSAKADIVTWEPDAALGSPTGGSGTWDTTSLFWDNAGVLQAWNNLNNDTAVFALAGVSTAPQTVTLNTGITAAGLTFDASNYTITGNTLTLAGTPTITVTNSGDVVRVNSALAGTAGFTTAGAGQLFLGGTNTFSGVMTVGSGSYVGLTNALALGSNAAADYTSVLSGGTLNIGGLAINGAPVPSAPGEEIRIAGAGVGGIGALINTFSGSVNSLGKVVLTADATVSAGHGSAYSYNAAGAVVNGVNARLDIRLTGTPTAGQKHLDLAGNTLTKIGGDRLVLVNADVAAGNIVVNEGILGIEGATLLTGLADGSNGAIQVNAGGKLAIYAISAATNVTRPIIVNGGTLGDVYSSSASQTINSPISIQGSANPNFVSANSNGAFTTTFAGLISQNQLTAPTSGVTQSAFTGTEVGKRGGTTVIFSNQANSFSAPLAIYAGALQGTFTPAFSGGTPSAPTLLAGTPLGTGSTLKIAGGTLNIRVDGSATNNEVYTIGKTLVLDLAPGGVNLDRISANTDKNLSSAVTFAAPSAANGWSIGQNQLTMNQGSNGYRLMLSGTTMNDDTVLNAGDYTFTGNTTSANKDSLVRIGGNSWGFIGGTHEFNAVFNIGSAQMRVGSMYGTGVTSTTVTVGSGTIYNGPNSSVSFRAATNLASGQLIDTLSQRANLASVNFESGFTAVPSNLRASGTGGLGVAGATFVSVDLSKIGDGTFRLGAGYAGAGNGTVSGAVTAGAGNVVRVGGVSTNVLTLSGTNSIPSTASLEVGSDLINGGFRTTQANAMNGVVLLSGANNFSGGTTINRSATLRFSNATPGSGAIQLFGNITAEGATGTFINAGANMPVNLYGGSTLRFDSSALTTGAAGEVNRWEDGTGIALLNSTLQLDARNNGSTTNETVGAITYGGGSTISLQRNNGTAPASIVQLQTPSLTRSGGGTLEVTRAGSSGFQSNVRLITTSTVPTVTNGMVTPSIMTLDASTGTNFANFDPTNGITNATYTGTLTTAFSTGLLSTGNYFVDFAGANTTLALGDDPTVYALKVGGGTGATTINTSGTNDTITLRSGGLIFSGQQSGAFSTEPGAGQTRTITFNPNLVANDGTLNIEAIINTRNAFTATIAGTVTSSGLTKFGAGTLILTNPANAITGTTYINQGTLELRGAAAAVAPAGTSNLRLQGGQLNVRGSVSHTITNGLTVAQNIPIANLDANRSDASSTGTITFNPLVAGPGLVLEGSPGAQGQTLNVNGGNYGVTFGANANNSFTGNVTLNTVNGLTLNNNPTILGTNPVITKSGAGTLDIGSGGGAQSVSSGTQVVVNAGTLQVRSVVTFGGSAQSTYVLNGGALNLRRDGDSVFGSSAVTTGAAHPVIAAGNSAISVDRSSTGSNNLHTLGKLTVGDGVSLAVSSGNNFSAGFQGALFNGTAFISSTIAVNNDANSATRFLSGFDVAGGALVKSGTGHLHLLSANNSYDGGTYVQQGIVRLRAAGAAGTGALYVNPGATIDFNAANNLSANQPFVIRGNSALLTMVSVNANGVTHPTGANVDFSGASTGIIGLSNGATVYNNAIDLSALYGGRWSLGGISASPYDPRYTAASLGAGADNLYRIGGGGTSMFISISDTNGTPRNNLLTGPNSVRFGFDSGNILAVNGTNHQIAVGGTQDFTGDTVIHRGVQVVLGTAANASGKSGLSSGSVDVFGTLVLRSGATFQNAGVATNALNLHAGSYLNLDNNAAVATNMAAANVANRIADTQAITLRGSLIEFIGANNAGSTETLGDTTFSAGARLRVARNGSGTATLTLNSLTAGTSKGSQLILQSSGANTLGVSDKIIVSSGAPSPTFGMVDPKFVNATDLTFVTYNGVNGFTNITAYDKTPVTGYTAGNLLPSDKVDVTGAALSLSDNPTIYALRVSQSINNAGPYNQMTIRSGGLIANGASTVSPNLVFNDGSQNVEAKIYTNSTLTINGAITADGIVKSGSGSLTINVPQASYASGWVVNSGDLNFQDPGGAGQSVAGNTITINATPSHSGLVSQVFGRSRVVFQRDSGTAELLTFTGGTIKVVNDGDIAILANNDRQIQIPGIATESTGTGASAALTLDVRSNRFRAVIPTLTLNSDTTVRLHDSTATTNTGFWTHASVGSLVGTDVRLNKIGNRAMELSGDNSATFTGGSINVGVGTLRVLNNGALGSATTTTTIERNAALEIGVANFSPAGALTQNAGSIERWNVEDARGTGNYTVPAGVNLQLNTSLLSATPRVITLNGGSLEGFLYADHVAQVNQRTVGSAVTLNLAANSYVGQNILNGQNYEAGRAPTVASPFADNYSGSFLRIEGPITGAGNLTKTGLDTVTIASTGNTYGNTIVEMGVLRIAANNALPTGKTLTTRNGGTFDMYGFNQTVAGLGVDNAGANPGGTGVGISGEITNSGVTDNTLTVNNSDNFTYNGVIERNIALTKQGAGTLTLGGVNTYVGVTAVTDGTLIVSGSIAGSATTVSGGTLKGAGTVGSLAILAGGTLAPGNSPGILNAGNTDFGGGTFALEINGTVVGTNYDQLNVNGSISFTANTPLSISLGFDPADDGSQLFTILANDGLDAINTSGGLFSFGGNPLTEGAQFDSGSQLFSISYVGGSGNDVVLTAVPEPSSASVLLAGLASLAGLKRRRRRNA